MNTTTPNDSTELREIISPEGVEERIEREELFRMTLTQGGKFRVYHVSNGNTTPVGVFETKDEAEKSLGYGMMAIGGLLNDPKRTLDALLSGLKKS